jgi:hypothetical protein
VIKRIKIEIVVFFIVELFYLNFWLQPAQI